MISRGVEPGLGTPNPLALSPALVIPALSPAAEQALVQIQCIGRAAPGSHTPAARTCRIRNGVRWGNPVRSCITVSEMPGKVAPVRVEIPSRGKGDRWDASEVCVEALS